MFAWSNNGSTISIMNRLGKASQDTLVERFHDFNTLHHVQENREQREGGSPDVRGPSDVKAFGGANRTGLTTDSL